MSKFTYGQWAAALLVLGFQPERLPGQPVYEFSHLQVESCAYQAANPGQSWTLNSDYLLFLPADHDLAEDPLPVLFFLHGAGRRGSDLNQVATLAPPAQAEKGTAFSFAVVAPQCRTGRNWAASTAELMQFIEEVITRFNFDRDRVYLCGQSMGGYGTWSLLTNYPDFFAAAIPVCGGGDPSLASKLVDIPIWAFHGRLDNTVPVRRSIEMVEAIKDAGGTQARLTIYEDVGHSSWFRAFKEPDLYDWMLRQSKGVPSPLSWNGFERGPDGWVDTGSLVGWLNVTDAPWIWCIALNGWLFAPESGVSPAGLWAFVSK
jgi:predicted peptidase